MKRDRCILRALPLVCGCVVSMVHTTGQSQVVTLENFSERLTRDVPVSGRVLVGALVLQGGTGNAPAALTPRLLWRGGTVESAKESLCVTLASRDGRYYGEGKLSPATLGGLAGPVRLQGTHKSTTEKHLRALALEDLAMLASIGDCRVGTTGDKTVVYLLDRRDDGALARQGSAPSEFILQLFLNSMTYTLTVEASAPSFATRQAACRALDNSQRNTAFDMVCELNVPNTATVADLVIKRRRYERGFEPIQFKLVWTQLLF